MSKVIYLGADHAGFELKQKIAAYLKTRGYAVRDLGPHTHNPDDDYPDFTIPVAQAVAKHKKALGIALGGSGIGECIAANKVRGARAVRAWNIQSAKMSRWHNDANVLCFGAGKTVDKAGHGIGLSLAQAKPIINIFLATPFSGAPRHLRRLKKIADYEKLT